MVSSRGARIRARETNRAPREPLTSSLSSGLYRRLRNYTESADPAGFCIRQALAGLGKIPLFGPYRRWGLSPRPEKFAVNIDGNPIMAGGSKPGNPLAIADLGKVLFARRHVRATSPEAATADVEATSDPVDKIGQDAPKIFRGAGSNDSRRGQNR